jgi:hypothetical protein
MTQLRQRANLNNIVGMTQLRQRANLNNQEGHSLGNGALCFLKILAITSAVAAGASSSTCADSEQNPLVKSVMYPPDAQRWECG